VRRWFELGNAGNIISGQWSYDSDRWGGEFPAMFVSMPHKEIIFEWLSAMQTNAQISAIYVKQVDQGVDPDPACQAQHIPRAYNQDVVALPPFIAQPALVSAFGIPIFADLNFSGSYGPGLFQFSTDPPSKFGG